MALSSRDYYGGDRGGPGRDWLPGAPVTRALLLANGVVFVVEWLLRSASGRPWGSVLTDWGAYTVADGFFGLQFWRLLTFQFLHADLFHLLFNMFALYTFGPMVERWWRSRPFLAFYLVSGLAGALGFTLLWAVPGVLEGMRPDIPLVGASAGIFGILIASAMIAPDVKIMLLIPPVPMKMRTYAILVLAFGLYIVLVNGRNAGGEAGHLGGALAGFLMMVSPPLRRLLGRLGA